MPRALNLLALLLVPGCCAGWDDPPPRRGGLEEEARRWLEASPEPGPGQVSVSVERLAFSASDALEVEALWRYVRGGVDVGSPGFRSGAAGEGFDARVRVLERSGRLRSRDRAFVLVREGENGRLALGASGLSVRARREGARVDLELWSVAPGASARTRVLVRPGEPLLLGGTQTGGEDFDRWLFGAARHETSSRSLLLVTVR